MSAIFILIEFDIILIKLLCSHFVCFYKWYNSLLSLLFGSSSYCILYSYTICDTVSFFNEMFAQSEEGDEQDIQYLVKQQDHSWCEGVQVITSITASCCWWESVFRNIEARRSRGSDDLNSLTSTMILLFDKILDVLFVPFFWLCELFVKERNSVTYCIRI